MPTFDAAPPPVPGERNPQPGGTVYGAPVAARPLQDRPLRIAIVLGVLGVLVGLLFATGLLAGGGQQADPGPLAGGGPAPAPSGGAAAGATPEAPPSPSPTPDATPTPALTLGPTQPRTFRSVASTLCLDITPGEDPEGADVRQSPCTAAASQQWQPAAAGADTVTLVNRGSGKCLDVDNFSTADGAPVQQWSCNGGANQQWRFSHGIGPMVLVNVHSGKCVALAAPGAGAGTRVQQVGCDGAIEMQWLGQPLT